jgi:hypothetical protein
MIAAPDIKFSGQSLHTLDDASLLQLLLRDDLPDFLTTMYSDEADRRMAEVKGPA